MSDRERESSTEGEQDEAMVLGQHKSSPCEDQSDCYTLIPYGYSILDYARIYDREWNENVLNMLRKLFSQSVVIPTSKTDPTVRAKRRQTNSFPTEIVLEIMKYTDVPSLLVISRTCRDWYRLSIRYDIWEHLLREDFAVQVQAIAAKDNTGKGKKQTKDETVNPKFLYRKMHEKYQQVIRQELYGLNQAFSSSRKHFVPSSLFSTAFAR